MAKRLKKDLAEMSFGEDLEGARDYAKQMSLSNSSKRYLIQVGDTYCVSTTNSIQSYEVLLETYQSGRLVQPQPTI